jgi:hypothetical protein
MTAGHGIPAVSAAFNPDTAAHSAKNAHAASGLPNHHARSDSERSPMVGTTTALSEVTEVTR